MICISWDGGWDVWLGMDLIFASDTLVMSLMNDLFMTKRENSIV